MLAKWMLIAAGGALGAVFRVGLGEVVSASTGKGFWGTFCVNLLGCFIMGGLKALVEHEGLGSEAARTFLLGGFIGAFTTFSTFMADGVVIWREGSSMGTILYLGGSVIGGGICFLLAWWLATRFMLAGGGGV